MVAIASALAGASFMKQFLGRNDHLVAFRIEWNCGQVAAVWEAFGEANAFTKSGWQ